VRQAFYGEEIQRLPRDGDEVRVYVRYPRSDRRTLESLGSFRVRAADGREIPLAAVATWEFQPGVTGLDRRQRLSSILVEAELISGDVRADVMRTLNEEFFPGFEQRYPTVSRTAVGEAEGEQRFMMQLVTLGIMALFGMYFLLAATFRSYFQPAVIMSVLPFAMVGGIIGHFVLGVGWALFSYFGMVAAMGVVVNDNVVMINKCNQIRGYFAMRRKRAGQAMPEANIPLEEYKAANGEVWEVATIDPDVELHPEMIEQGLASEFESGPMERRASTQMRWEKSEFREHSEDLEELGFQVLRVHGREAIVEASTSRFRQITLTSATTFIALCPMLLENAAIVQFLKPMALALAGGVVMSLPVTLILTPALYIVGIDIKRGITALFRAWGRAANGRRQGLAQAE
jgi:multidrug efflux pump subunit AcrB